MSIMDTFRQEFEYEAPQTRKVFARLPEDKFDWQPHAKSMSLGRLAGHVAEIPGWIVETVKRDELVMEGYQPPDLKTRDELLNFYDENCAQARQAMEGVSDEAMHATWTMKDGSGNVFLSMPRALVFRNFIMNHLVHHRAQLTVYMRLLDVPVPAIYGPSADEQS